MAVSSSDPPYQVKADGTVGRPPADPRAIAICLLIRAIFGYSYRSVYSFLASSRDYRDACGITRLPGYNTIQEHCKDVPEKYLDGLVRLTAALIMLAQHRTRCNSGCDSTGLSTRKYGRWLEVRNSRRKKKRRFVKLHAHTTTDAEMPFFLSAKVTKGYKADSKQFRDLEEYETHYHRRSVVEGLFNAFKERFGREVASKIRHNQNVDALCRVLAWNVLALAYHSSP